MKSLPSQINEMDFDEFTKYITNSDVAPVMFRSSVE